MQKINYVKKYAISPGFIMSANDSDEHFVSAKRLIELYGVDTMECVVVTQSNRKILSVDRSLTWLMPRFDGKYR